MKWMLKAPSGYSLDAVVQSHGWSQLDPFRILEPSGLSCVIGLSSNVAILVSVTEQKRGLAVSTAARLGSRQRARVDASLNWMLGLDQEFRTFYRAARAEPKLARVPREGWGRMLRSATLFEDIVKTILTTNTTWAGTIRMVSRLVNLYGIAIAGDDHLKAFPPPDRLASASLDELRKETGLGYRAPYVSALAEGVASGSIDLDAIRVSDLPTPELRKQLLSLKGVGPYAAATLLMLLGRYDYLPVDSWALKLVSTEWYDGEPVGKMEVESAFEPWGEWKALAYWFWDWELLKERSG
jgi:3-methyladenine DNA glycosylase/8-oxoguanine DNA glycosylase